MAGRIPQQFIDDLMSRVDIVEVIDERVPLKRKGGEFAACCPFHDEKTPSFYVSPTKQFFHCFGCGAHGTALGFLMDYEHMGFVEAVEDLAGRVGLEVPREGGAAPRREDSLAPLYDLLDRAAGFYRGALREHAAGRQAVDYLKRRGLTGEIAREYGIGFAPPGYDHLRPALGGDDTTQRNLIATGMLIERDDGRTYDRFRNRVMFPIRDHRGRTIAFGGRVLDDAEPKYLNSPETPVFHKGRELYGLYEARKAVRKLERLMVVEGYMDVVSLAQHGLRYAVATLGTATTADHLDRLFRLVSEVVFCFDGDRAGRDAAWRALQNALPVMREGRQILFMFLPEGEDPDTLVRREGVAAFEARIEDALTFSTFLFKHLGEQVDMDSIDGRARLVELARPLLRQLPASVFRDMLVQRLAELAGMEAGRIEAAVFNDEARAPGAGEVLPAPSRPRRPGNEARRTTQSPLRVAIGALLQRPDLAEKVEDATRYRAIEGAGGRLLADVVELLQARPHLSSGALLEHWRGQEEGRYLTRLAQWQPLVDEAALTAEFTGALERLDRQIDEARLDALLHKSRLGELSAEEKSELSRLFRRVPEAD